MAVPAYSAMDRDTSNATPPPNIAAERTKWLRAVASDQAVKLVALRVAIIIAEHINSDSRDAWISQESIATILSNDPSGVSRAVKGLAGLGHLEVKTNAKGRRYRLLHKGNPVNNTTRVAPPDKLRGNAKRQAAQEKLRPSTTENVRQETTAACAGAQPIIEEYRKIMEAGAHGRAGASIAASGDLCRKKEDITGAGASAPEGARSPQSPYLSARRKQSFDSEIGDQVWDRISELFGIPGPQELNEIWRYDPEELGKLVHLYQWEVAKGDRDPVDLPTFLACLPSARADVVKERSSEP